MRIPNLNVSDSITRTLRELESQRLKLDKQISTGQKLSLPEDDGMRMGQAIKLDSEKGKLAQYQRNSSYASEFINAGHINLDKLRELNLRAQEIARMAGNTLSEPAIDGFVLETNQIIEEALNRINGRQRGHSLFGGTELKPDFTNSDIVRGEFQKKILNLESNQVGREISQGVRYLKQGDEIVLSVNGFEYVVEAKVLNQQDFKENTSYSLGDIVKVSSVNDYSIKTNISVDTDTESDNPPSFAELLSKLQEDWSQKDWSKQAVGKTTSGEDVYLLDQHQVEEITDSVDQSTIASLGDAEGGYFSLIEKEGVLYLHPVEVDTSTFSEIRSFNLKKDSSISYWEPTQDNPEGNPLDSSADWVEVNPLNQTSNLSTTRVLEIFKDLLNTSGGYFDESIHSESTDHSAHIRRSRDANNFHNTNLDIVAQISADGMLEITGSVGETFQLNAQYLSAYDSENYFPNQVDRILEEKVKELFPERNYVGLSQSEKDTVWSTVISSKVPWQLGVNELTESGKSTMDIYHSSNWKRLGVYQRGDVVKFEDKIWESISDENINHLPTQSKSEFWKELGSGYDVEREDWVVKNVGVENRFYFSTPDGKLFEDKQEAENHTINLLLSSTNRIYTDNTQLFDDIDSLVNEISYAVAQYQSLGSDSESIVYFDSASQRHRLSTFKDGENAVSGTFFHGDIKKENESLSIGDLVLKEGKFFLALESSPSPAKLERIQFKSGLDPSLGRGTKIFDPGTEIIFMSLGDTPPRQGKETILSDEIGQRIAAGSYIYDRASDEYFVATRNLDESFVDDIEFNFKFLGQDFIPEDDLSVITLSDDISQSVQAGSIVRNSSTGEYYEALSNHSEIRNEDLSPKFVATKTHTSEQGSEWSANRSYFKGQIISYRGTYYECQTNGENGNGFTNEVVDNSQLYAVEPPPILVRPDEEFFFESEDTVSREYLDLQKAKGEDITNNVWLPVGQSTQHLFSFSTENSISSTVNIKTAGAGGVDAMTSVITDSNGKVSGIRVLDGGRYFFNINESDGSVPEEYSQADVLLPDGQNIKANIIWGENTNDPGPYVILGFELLEEAYIDQPIGSSRGDDFSFATGSKTFLDHRNASGDVIAVTYTGGQSNSQLYIGKDTKISSFLDAEDGNTAELADVVGSLIELREGLKEDSPGELSRRVQIVESDLVRREDLVVDKLGELSSLLVRMESVRAYDEDYHQLLEQRLAKDLDTDLSEAIMELTRVSTAYQAAMQVSAQLLNTSLLNYL